MIRKFHECFNEVIIAINETNPDYSVVEYGSDYGIYRFKDFVVYFILREDGWSVEKYVYEPLDKLIKQQNCIYSQRPVN